MPSDRLSFNQGVDNEDDGARWEAYEALLRRKAAASPFAGAEDGAEDTGAAGPGLHEHHDPEPFDAADPDDEDDFRADPYSGDSAAPLEQPGAEAAFPGGLQLDLSSRTSPSRWPLFILAAALMIGGAALAAMLIPHAGIDASMTARNEVVKSLAAGGAPQGPVASIPTAPEPAKPATPSTPRADVAVISTPEPRQPEHGVANASPPVRPAGKSSDFDPKPAKLALEKSASDQSPALRTRREQPQCWAADATGASRLVDCPDLAPTPAAVSPGDGYLHLPSRPRN